MASMTLFGNRDLAGVIKLRREGHKGPALVQCDWHLAGQCRRQNPNRQGPSVPLSAHQPRGTRMAQPPGFIHVAAAARPPSRQVARGPGLCPPPFLLPTSLPRAPHLTPMVNMASIGLPCSQPSSRSRPGERRQALCTGSPQVGLQPPPSFLRKVFYA